MGFNRFYFFVSILFVLDGALLVAGTTVATVTDEASTATDANTTTMMADSSTSSTGNETSMVTPEDNSTSDPNPVTQECLICSGDKDSGCNDDPADESSDAVTVISGCASCTISKLDSGEGTDLIQIVRSCEMSDPCPSDDEEDFTCMDNSTQRKCAWCCTGAKCNDYNLNGGNDLKITGAIKIAYFILWAIVVSMSMMTVW